MPNTGVPQLDAENETAGVFGVPDTKPAPDASVTDWDTLTRPASRRRVEWSSKLSGTR